MKILNHVQGSQEWLSARASVPTASEFHNLFSDTGEVRTGEMPRSYLGLKLAERWMGGPVMSFAGGSAEQGTLLEPEAIGFFEVTLDITIQRVGLVLTDDGTYGASPDGLSDGVGWEVKSPQPHTFCTWLMDGTVPKKHLMQIHGGMLVTGLKEWRFAAYRRGFPSFVLTVKRDEKLMEVMRKRLALFTADLNREYARLIERNGGPPQRPTPSTSEQLNDHPFI